MNLLVFTKRVPATQEEELRIVDEGKKVDLSKVPFKVNDWDNYAVEEAVRIAEKTSGSVTAISIGNAESDEVLRRAIAMGGKEGFLIETATVYDDPNARATLACNFLKKEAPAFDAIFTGVQSEDDQFAAVGGILAAKMGLPYVSMVIGIDTVEKDHMIVRRELGGRPSGTGQGDASRGLFHTERYQRAQICIHHGRKKGIQGGAQSF